VVADSQDDILSALEILVDGIRTDLGESQKDDGGLTGVPLEKVTTSSLAALNAFSIAGQRYLQGDAQSAIDLLHRAIEIDNEFASAYAQLGVIYSNMGRPSSEYAHFWKTALSLGDRLPEKEKLHIQATMSWLEKPEDMRRAWTLVTNVFPDDAAAHHNLGVVHLQHLNQGIQALENFKRATELPNANLSASLIYLSFAQLFDNRLEEAVASSRRAYDIAQNPFNFALADGCIASLRYDEAKAFLDEHDDLPAPLSRMYRQSRFILYHLDRGELQLALGALDQAKMIFDSIHSRHSIELGLLGLAILEHSGNADAFDVRLTDELTFVDRLLQGELSMSDQGYNPVFALRVAAIAARSGKVDAARAIYDAEWFASEIDGYPVRMAIHEVLGAEIAIARGNLDEAVAILESSIDQLETFDARATLARAQELNGNTTEAIRHYAWIRQNRGRAFGEWLEELTGRELNVIEWSMAAYHLARMHEDSGNVVEAANLYDQFIEHWQGADRDIPRLNDAASRRSQL
jgi:tetratricopeptide (TPR) repeat protein